MDWAACIEKRHSVRRYKPQPVNTTLINQVVAAGKGSVPLYPDIDIRWYMVWNGQAVAQYLGKLADVWGDLAARGLTHTAPHYIIAVSQDRPGYMENLGFRMEQLILAATGLGLGTCWIGGMFVEEGLHHLVPDLGADELIVALTPLGYEDDSQSARMAHQLMRWGHERPSGERKPLEEIVSQDTWSVPWSGEDRTWNRVLELVQLAPSWANVQPWHLVVSGQTIILAVSRTPPKGDQVVRPYYRLDGGIAMSHLHLAALAAGWSGHWIAPAANEPYLRTRYAIPNEYDILGIFRISDEAPSRP